MKSFFSRQKFLNSIAEEVRVESFIGMGRSLWVVGRALCLFKAFFIPLPPRDRNEALSLQLQQWSPFSQTGQYVVWQDSYALVWIWDEETRQLLATRVEAGNALVVPEDLFFSPPEKDGVRLLHCLSGIVAEYWHENVLRDSRWWAESPSSKAVNQFYCNNDLSIPPQLPECVSSLTLKKPWGIATVLHDPDKGRYEQFFLPILGVVFLILGYQAVTLVKWTRFEQHLVARVEELTAQVEPVLTARRQTYEQKSKIVEFAKLSPYPAQLHIWAVVVRKLSTMKATVETWRYRNGTLELVLQGDKLDPGVCIRTFSEGKLFTEISPNTSRQAGQLSLKMTIAKKDISQPLSGTK